MTRRLVAASACAAALALLLGGCGYGSREELPLSPSDSALADGGTFTVPPTYTGPATPVPASSAEPSATSGGSGTGTAPASSDSVAAVTGLHDGTWLVGDAGKLDFRLSNGTLELVNAQPATGWTKQVPVKTPAEIEVRFVQTGASWTFHVLVKGGSMTVVKEQALTDAPAGSYPVADAGSVTWATASNELVRQNVEAQAGWQVTAQQAAASSIDVSFAQGARTASFAARLSGGAVTVTSSSSLSGPLPS